MNKQDTIKWWIKYIESELVFYKNEYHTYTNVEFSSKFLLDALDIKNIRDHFLKKYNMIVYPTSVYCDVCVMYDRDRPYHCDISNHSFHNISYFIQIVNQHLEVKFTIIWIIFITIL